MLRAGEHIRRGQDRIVPVSKIPEDSPTGIPEGAYAPGSILEPAETLEEIDPLLDPTRSHSTLRPKESSYTDGCTPIRKHPVWEL